MEINEKDVILKCKIGDFGQFEILYEFYVRKIYKFIYFKTLNKALSEDLTSEIFLKAIKNINKFDTEKRFAPWLYSIARNTLIDYFRTRKVTENIDNIWDIKGDSDLLKQVDDKLNYEKVKGYMSNLSAIQKDIITMRVWADMSHAEIAQALGITEQNSKVIFSRSIAKLRDIMPLSLLILFIIKL
ncbi:MAG: sigma-70 family RNA polymerase sigma factor [bacterium]|nr:sigma-70 family RNA polymerase sigma factor [bacterium]